jgi:hypothetical protein
MIMQSRLLLQRDWHVLLRWFLTFRVQPESSPATRNSPARRDVFLVIMGTVACLLAWLFMDMAYFAGRLCGLVPGSDYFAFD